MKEAWNRFLHWPGWRACGSFFGKGWEKMVRWKGWKPILFLHPVLLLVLILVCTVGMIAVFRNGWEMTVFAVLVYSLSAYTLVAACIKVPGVYRGIHRWIGKHSRLKAVLENGERKLKFRLYFGQMINFGYGAFKVIGGFLYGSAWLIAEGIYNLMQGVIQLFHILRRRKSLTMLEQWESYRMSGVLILLLHLTMTGLVFLMVNRGMSGEYPGFQIFATAAFAFYKIISAFVKVAKDRKHTHPMDSAIRMLKLSQAFFSMFSLQVGMFHVFGNGDAWERWMNTASGVAVCILVVSMGIYMIRRANRDMKPYQEPNGG